MTRIAELNQLKEENTALRLKMLDLEQLMTLQQSIAQQYQELSIYLMNASHFSEFTHTLLVSAPRMLMIDHMSLLFMDDNYDLRHLLADLQIPFSQIPHLTFLDKHTNTVYPFDEHDLRPFIVLKQDFHHSALIQDESVQQIAIIPIKRNLFSGYLCLGSYQKDFFDSPHNHDFIDGLTLLVATCLENVLHNAQLQHIGFTDTLTSLYNRRYVNQRLQEEVTRAQREDQPIAVLYIDVDHFKNINDKYGHLNGDIVLKTVSLLLKQGLRLSDVLGRFGGEEFIAILPNTTESEAIQIAERLRLIIAGKGVQITSQEDSLMVTVSIGITCIQPQSTSTIDQTIEQLLSQADIALYRAKAQGRNFVVSYDNSVVSEKV